MKLPSLPKTRMLTPTNGERLTASPLVVLFLFLLVLLSANAGRTAVSLLAAYLIPHSLSAATQLLISLFATVVTVAAVLAFCLAVERRSLYSLGLAPRGAVAEYAVGLAGGIVLFSAAVLLCMMTGCLTLSAAPTAPGAGTILLFLLGFLIQGMSEELLCRSYLMVSLSRGWPLWACVVTNAALFSVIHLGNPGVSGIALCNIFLFGVFASLLTLKRGSIWMAAALHSTWNFAQGNLFGIPVSGMADMPSPLCAEMTEGVWQKLIHGGAFGLEGGLSVTVVLLAAGVVAVLMPAGKSELAAASRERDG